MELGSQNVYGMVVGTPLHNGTLAGPSGFTGIPNTLVAYAFARTAPKAPHLVFTAVKTAACSPSARM